MKNNGRLIRLVVYLVVSISLIVLLWNINKNKPTQSKNDFSSITIDSTLEKNLLVGDFLFVSKASYSGKLPITAGSFPINLPPNNEDIIPNEHIYISIDSNNVFYLNDSKIIWNELVDSIVVQHEKKPKLSILISVHKKANSELVLKIMNLAKKKKIKVGIRTN